jgi:hypothetical protein
MIRALTKSEVGELVIRLAVAGFVPGRDFTLNDEGQILASPEVREFLRCTSAWAPDDLVFTHPI